MRASAGHAILSNFVADNGHLHGFLRVHVGVYVHLQAGHGAANVTMGIPRLRELLQRGAVTKTPILYIPIRTAPLPSSSSPAADKKKKRRGEGEEQEEKKHVAVELGVAGGGEAGEQEDHSAEILMRNMGTALRGFTTIRLSDCVHSLGVEANVCYHVRRNLHSSLSPSCLSLSLRGRRANCRPGVLSHFPLHMTECNSGTENTR